MFLVCFSLFLGLFANISFSADGEHEAFEDRTGYYCTKFQPHMIALLDQINKETVICIKKCLYEESRSRKKIGVVYSDFKKRYDMCVKKLDERNEMLLIAKQNSEDLKFRKTEILDALKKETELDAENFRAYAKILWTEYYTQLSANRKQIGDIDSEIANIQSIVDQMKPHIDETDRLTAGSITHKVLLDFAKEQEPDVFDVSAPALIESIKGALVHLLGDDD